MRSKLPGKVISERLLPAKQLAPMTRSEAGRWALVRVEYLNSPSVRLIVPSFIVTDVVPAGNCAS